MTYIVIPPHLFPKTAGDLYRIVTSFPTGTRARVTDIRDGRIYWVPA